tara:strand:- start:115 stop:387 length:273 start_codon:yes stop_codon:yes gene_type:complete
MIPILIALVSSAVAVFALIHWREKKHEQKVDELWNRYDDMTVEDLRTLYNLYVDEKEWTTEFRILCQYLSFKWATYQLPNDPKLTAKTMV